MNGEKKNVNYKKTLISPNVGQQHTPERICITYNSYSHIITIDNINYSYHQLYNNYPIFKYV